jgi:hypothetical protein
MKKFNYVLLSSLLFIILIPFNTTAQYQIPIDIIASGGGTIQAPGYILSGTAGEIFTGNSGSAINQLRSGFWFIYYFDVITYAGDENVISSVFRLEQNYPNPFNPSTTVRFAVPERNLVTIRLYDLLGEEVLQVINEEKEQGWYDIIIDLRNLASGIYIYRMNAGKFVSTRKMMLIK